MLNYVTIFYMAFVLEHRKDVKICLSFFRSCCIMEMSGGLRQLMLPIRSNVTPTWRLYAPHYRYFKIGGE